MTAERREGLSTSTLQMFAMICMLADHLWATLIPGNAWLTCLGRLAFPIYAFLLVEGYFHTKDLRRYMRRLLVFALLSEIPFNLMYSSGLVYPFHQNVLWTFLLGMVLIRLNEKAAAKGKWWLRVLTAAASVLLGYLLGILLMVDYNGAGVLTVLVFYFFRGRKWWNFLLQAAALYYINVEMLSGIFYPIRIGGWEFELVQQSLALLALLPIWLYRGKQGIRSKAFQYFRYVFYPAHMLVLYLLRSLIW